MMTPSRAAFRLALAGCMSLTGLFVSAAPCAAAVPPEKTLPASTFLFVKVENASELRSAFKKSQFGQLLADPAMSPLKDDIAVKLEDANKKVKEKLGATLADLLRLPQGAAWMAVQTRDDPKLPIAVLVSVDAGENAKAMKDVMNRATKQGADAGAKVTEEKFKDQALTIIQDAKDEGKNSPPLVWANVGSFFHVTTDVDVMKDLISHADGREGSLAENESFVAVKKKLGDGAQAIWFLDISQVFKLVTTAAGAQGGNAQQIEMVMQLTGLNALKAGGGSLSLNLGEYDHQIKTFFLSPGPSQGILKLFQMPKVNLKPEPWVPASTVSYQSVSWDLDGAYAAASDLMNMFAPGVLDQVEKGLVGPDGGAPLSLQKDIFGPVGNRITVIGDYKKPITEKSQRILFALALQDAKASQNTLTKILAMTMAKPKKREFQGTTIYDFEIPEVPGGVGPRPDFKGPVSVAIAKNNLFATTDPTFLEQVLREGGSALVDTPGFQSVAKQLPEQTSMLSYEKSEEQFRVVYDLIKTGQFQKALQGANMVGGPGAADKAGEIIDPAKLPDFSVIAKYLSQGGSYGVMDDDGLTVTRFSLRKVNP